MEWCNFLGVYWVFTLSGSRFFSIELKQDNQAKIHQGSSTWIPYFGLATNSVRRFLWCSGSVCSRLLSFFFYQVFISNELKQVDQATIFHGSWTWSLHSNLLHLEKIVLSWNDQWRRNGVRSPDLIVCFLVGVRNHGEARTRKLGAWAPRAKHTGHKYCSTWI